MSHRPCPRYFGLVLLAVLVAASASAESRQATIDEPVFGGKAFVLEAGHCHERSVVLVHGLGDDASRAWDLVVPELAREYHVLAFDLPGFGRSTRANELYDPERYVAFLDFLVSQYVSGRFALVGHSMGGAIALRYAAAHPDKINRLIVVDVAGILHRVAYSKAVAQLRIEHLPGTYPAEQSVSRWIGDLLSTHSRVSRFTVPVEKLILTTPAMRRHFLQGDPNKIAAYALVLEDFSPWILRVTAPTLVVWGAKDPIAPLRTGKLLASNIPGARLKVIPGAQHTPMKSQPMRFHRILTGYLAIPPEDLAAGRTNGAPYALAPTVSWASDRVGRCDNRGGPRNLDSGLRDISIVFQAAVPKPVVPKYTTSGVRRPREL